MDEPFRLMCVFAHPDDESLGTGSTLAKYAAEGVETTVVCATRGERGWMGDEKDTPRPRALGRLREAELRAAARALGIREVSFLDYVDGDLDQANPEEVVAKIVGHLRRVKPQVVITFPPDGTYGHPDHIAISQFTSTAIVSAADCSYDHANGNGHAPHRVSKLYYMAERREMFDRYLSVFGDIVMPVDGVDRRPVAWADWAITTRIDGDAYWREAARAILCHKSQVACVHDLARAIEQQHRELVGLRTYYRAFSTVNGGRKVERDLFEGLR